MANRARPFVIKVKVGDRPHKWVLNYQTRRGGTTYNWYRADGGQSEKITRSDKTSRFLFVHNDENIRSIGQARRDAVKQAIKERRLLAWVAEQKTPPEDIPE